MADFILNTGKFILITPDDARPSSDTIARVTAMVDRARLELERMLGAVVNAAPRPWFRRCFEAYFRGNPSDLNAYMKQLLEFSANLNTLNKNVQSAELTIQFPQQTSETVDASAYVMRSGLDVLSEKMKGPDPATPAKFFGAINMFPNKLGTLETSAANLIHEATHRYLGTRDWAYCPNYNMLDWEKNIGKKDGPSPNAIKRWYQMTAEEAINNADSYGGFMLYGTEQNYKANLLPES